MVPLSSPLSTTLLLRWVMTPTKKNNTVRLCFYYLLLKHNDNVTVGCWSSVYNVPCPPPIKIATRAWHWPAKYVLKQFKRCGYWTWTQRRRKTRTEMAEPAMSGTPNSTNAKQRCTTCQLKSARRQEWKQLNC